MLFQIGSNRNNTLITQHSFNAKTEIPAVRYKRNCLGNKSLRTTGVIGYAGHANAIAPTIININETRCISLSLSLKTILPASTVSTGAPILVSEARNGSAVFNPRVPVKMAANITTAIIAVLRMVILCGLSAEIFFFINRYAPVVNSNTITSCVVITASGGNILRHSHIISTETEKLRIIPVNSRCWVHNTGSVFTLCFSSNKKTR